MPVTDRLEHQLDSGNDNIRLREKWWQLWRPKSPPPPPPQSLTTAPIIPIVNASFISVLMYSWITPIMTLGYQRPLQATDLWKMDPSRESTVLGEKFDAAWERRVEIADEWNIRVAHGEVFPGLLRKSMWAIKALGGIPGNGWKAQYQHYCETWGTAKPSLALALNDTFGWQFWLGGCVKVISDTATLMGPLVAKEIINFGKAHYAARISGGKTPPIATGVGMAIGLLLMNFVATVGQQQFFWRSMSTGVLARAALISSIYKRGVNLAPSARAAHPSSALVNHISTDVSRIDACAQYFHASWTTLIQLAVCLTILLVQLGPSALAGFSLFIILTPLQERAMAHQFNVRQRSMHWTDQRAKHLQELLGAMRVVKWFTYEGAFLKRIRLIREKELEGVSWILLSRAANQALANSVPVLAAILSFVAYSLSGHPFDPAIIFPSLSLFQLLRQPLILLPRSLSAITDARSALHRLDPLFHAKLTRGMTFEIDITLGVGVRVEKACFEWEESRMSDHEAKQTKKEPVKKGREDTAGVRTSAKSQAPFALRNLNMEIPRGQLCAIVGPVGSGKSSLLYGLLGEMRKLSGSCVFGGSVVYCPQTAWIQNATLRDNILFGRPFDTERYWKTIRDASLLPDLETLPDGDLTEIGEKGINLSGGQKQRINIARALYYDADVFLLDDPLSAVDAHVGKSLFANAILGALKARGKTVVLVTHALHFLREVDYVYTIIDGQIAERGSYEELMQRGGPFAKLISEFGGGIGKDEEDKVNKTNEVEKTRTPKVTMPSETHAISPGIGKIEGRLMKAEKRTVGSISWKVYISYLKAGRGIYTLPVFLITAILMQSSAVMNSYTLVWWEADTFRLPESFYMTLFGCLGVGQAVFTMALGASMTWMSVLASKNLHSDAMQKIFHAPMAVFDTTPLGRMMSVFGKDIDVIDNQLSISLRLFMVTIATVLGSVIMVTILEHYFIIAVGFIVVGYYYFAAYYRRSARELKRLDANLRSLLYSHFSESLSGLATIRAYRELPRFLADNDYYCDLENRALYLTITNQRWLAVRLGVLGCLMVFVVAIMAVFGVNGISPAQIGLVLTYTTLLTQMFGMVTRQSAEVENFMNSVERVVHYSQNDFIEQEAPYENEHTKPPPNWPSEGRIEFKDVVMNYRSGLPDVLQCLSMSIRAAEKIGVVGRTGAGKSSLMVALFRLVELKSGQISIDGIDISTLGLHDLRSKISIIPQDHFLFSGTIRSNLDPFSIYDDARLYDALRRAYLVPVEESKCEGKGESSDGSGTSTPLSRFHLDTVIEADGANLSVGEKSLLSLARALVKDSKVIVLDEATASVDLETDTKIQYTIQTEFRDRTLLCIAHRLRTILSYDRILVLEAGKIAEFGRPLELFMQENGIFRGMCKRSNITDADFKNHKLL